MASTDESEIGTAELVRLDWDGSTVDFELLYDFVDPETLPCQIAQSGSSRDLRVYDNTRDVEVFQYSDIPSVSGEYTIDEKFQYDKDAELRFELMQLHVCDYDPETGLTTIEWYLEVTGTIGDPGEPEFLATDYDSDEDVELILWDAVKNDDGTLGWIDVELTGTLTGEGYYQIQEGPSTDDVVKDVTGITVPDNSEYTFPSDWSKVICWYIHPDLDNDLIVEAEFRARDSDEPFPGTENQSEAELMYVEAQQGDYANLNITFGVENVIVSGTGSTTDFNATVELNNYVDHKVEGTLDPGEQAEYQTEITDLPSGTHEVCIWI